MGSLSSLHLDAFMTVAQTRSFSRAAEKLHITQSALSQRVLNLEKDLESTLFIRERTGVRLTETGHGLLRYCQGKSALETEFLSGLRSEAGKELAGELRIGGFSSVNRSVILPALAPLLRKNPRVRLSLVTEELRDLPDLLRRGEIDFMILDRRLDRDDLESFELGVERNVLTASATNPSEIYLDHDEHDEITRSYLKAARKGAKIERRYLGDVYAVLDGVRLGIGKAVLPRHLLAGIPGISILDPGIELRMPVVLHFHSQPFYSKLHLAALETLRRECPRLLEAQSSSGPLPSGPLPPRPKTAFRATSNEKPRRSNA